MNGHSFLKGSMLHFNNFSGEIKNTLLFLNLQYLYHRHTSLLTNYEYFKIISRGTYDTAKDRFNYKTV